MPRLTDNATIAALLDAIQPGQPRSHGSLTVVPLLAAGLRDPGWLTLPEAGDTVELGEVGRAGAVPELQVVNRRGEAVLLLDGEELAGAKQNRILNTTVLVAAGAKVVIPVSCVEQGRWDRRARRTGSGHTSLYASLRGRKAGWVNESVRSGRGHRADQGAIWEALDARDRKSKVGSPTRAMHDFYVQNAPAVAAAQSALGASHDQVGALVLLAGRWVGLELLAAPRLFAQAWPRLCAGYVSDAIGVPPATNQATIPTHAEMLRMLTGCDLMPAPAVGLGTEYRLSGARAVGAVLVADGCVAHLMAFPADPDPGGP
jgi:hypothetical protein